MSKEIPQTAVICAARHFKAAHESACSGIAVDFGEVCAGCSELNTCKGDWTKTAAPIFDAADVYPVIVRSSELVPS